MKIKVKAAVFSSLRTNRKYKPDQLASSSGIPINEILEYERVDSSIDLQTLEKIAKIYKKRWTIFLLQTPEEKLNYGNDNRSSYNQNEDLDIDLINSLDSAEYILETGLEIVENESLTLPSINIKLSVDPEGYAKKLREVLKPDETQLHSLTDEYGPLRFWKNLLTYYGLYISELVWSTESVKAFSIYKNQRAVIVLSTKEEPNPRLFSLFHELAHVILKQTGICDLHEGLKDIEATCNQFSAAFLMPEESFIAIAKQNGIQVGVIPSESQVKALQRYFGTSRLATFRRLFTFGYISKSKYEEIQIEYENYQAQYQKGKSAGGNYYRNKISSNSRRFTTQAFDAYSEGYINSRALSRMVGVSAKNLDNFKFELEKTKDLL